VLCDNCNRSEVYAKNRCNACLRYYNLHGVERPAKLYTKILGRHQKNKPRWCKNCGSPELVANLRCGPCHNYHRRNKKERPRHLWDPEYTCKTCSVPLASVEHSRSGWCDPCYHFVKLGQERPRHLWGIGRYGWCECGFPAVSFVEDMPVCQRHSEKTDRITV
jgi:hypothetical protein